MKPLILDYKIERSESDQFVPYEYDITLSLNVILVNGNKKPFIEINTADVELMTKTKVKQESDDDSFSLSTTNSGASENMKNMLLELTTKTLVKQERDDERRDYIMELTH